MYSENALTTYLHNIQPVFFISSLRCDTITMPDSQASSGRARPSAPLTGDMWDHDPLSKKKVWHPVADPTSDGSYSTSE